jgi:MarR family transcriptional regulator, transcriptional regulator for hemolysin
MNHTEKLESILFYELDRAIKTYRQFAQSKLNINGFDITIDQWLILKTVKEHPDYTQVQIAKNVFKDVASVTRITELLVQKEYLKREFHTTDRRRSILEVTKIGESVIKDVFPLVKENRKQALKSISKNDIDLLSSVLKKITINCQSI